MMNAAFKYAVCVCGSLLVLILILEMRILARLDELAHRPISISAPGPSATTIARELREQMAKEVRQNGPVHFRVEARSGGQSFAGAGESVNPSSGHLQHVTLNITREGGRATDLTLKPVPGITTQFKKVESTDDLDRFELVFKPESGNYLPETWTFALTYKDRDQQAQERSFAVVYQAGKKWPDWLEIKENVR